MASCESLGLWISVLRRIGSGWHLLCMLYKVLEKRPLVLMNCYRYVWSHGFLSVCGLIQPLVWNYVHSHVKQTCTHTHSLTHSLTLLLAIEMCQPHPVCLRSLMGVHGHSARARAQCTSPLLWLMNPSLGWWPSDCKQEVDHRSGRHIYKSWLHSVSTLAWLEETDFVLGVILSVEIAFSTPHHSDQRKA